VPAAPQVREPAASPERRWYGGETLLSDVASLALVFGGLKAADGNGIYDSGTPAAANALTTLGLVGYAAGAPALHLIHERPLPALGSFGLRVGLPVLGGVLGSALAQCPPPPPQEYGSCGTGELVLGVSAGVLAAIVVDATVLGWKTEKPEPPAGPRVGFAPVISNDGKRAELHVYGSF